MAKGRHRKQQPTQLPPGATALTGKSRTASKTQIYNRPLPIAVEQNSLPKRGGAWEGAAAAASSTYTFPAWADYLLRLCGFPSTSAKKNQDGQVRDMDVVVGRWDPLSRSVYLDVTIPSTSQRNAEGMTVNKDGDEEEAGEQSAAMRYLWQSGFFGKGTLSRSEPTWHRRQVNAIRVKRERERGGKVFTPEELTALRRKERKAAKIERARLAVRAGQQLPDGIVALGGELTEEDERVIERLAEKEVYEEEKDESAYGKHIPGLIYLKPKTEGEVENEKSGHAAALIEEEEEYIDVADMERLQLSSYETFFLAGMLGMLQVTDENDKEIPIEQVYALLMGSSLPPSSLSWSPFTSPSSSELTAAQNSWARPDNPFLLHYIAYHHFRSLGWVVKSGIKFCVDFLLYKRGPAFSHAEFAVLVIPVYQDPEDEKSSPFPPHPNGGERDWVWFSSINRVNTQVLKTIVLCHVIIPPLSSLDPGTLTSPQGFVDALRAGRLHHVREYSIRRFTPQRMKA